MSNIGEICDGKLENQAGIYYYLQNFGIVTKSKGGAHIVLSREEAEKLYAANKYIPDDIYIEWIKTNPCNNSKNERYKLEVPVFTEDGIELSLRGNYSKSRRGLNYSFCLLYKNTIKIRRWDTSPNEFKIKTSHKHRWDGISDHETYLVNDICLNNVNEAFVDFLKECNIDFNGHYQIVF